MSIPSPAPSAAPARALIGRRGLLAAAALLTLSGCGFPTGRSDAEPATAPPHWDYDADGPEHWADIDGRYTVCGHGAAQSPVDLADHTPVDSRDHIDIDYGRVASVELVNTGHTVQANLPAGGEHRIVVGGRAFTLTQFHFHAPSEHTIDGVGAAMELHLVHGDGAGGLAVLAVLLREGPDSPFAPVLGDLPRAGDKRVLGPIDPRTFLPSDRTQFRYAGSLTTPPCTEGVAWTVLRDPVPVAVAEIERYRALFPHTNRPAQPLNGRSVVLAGG